MQPYPDLSPYYSDGDQDIKLRMESSYRQGITLQQQFWNEADIDTRFDCGDQTLWNQLFGFLPLQNRRTFQFNRIRRVVDMPAGYQRRNRKSTIITPAHDKDQDSADEMSSVIQWVHNYGDFYHTLSDAFRGALVSGLNLLSVWMDYRQDPINGEIRLDNRSYNGFMIDPTFKRMDFSDANYIWTRKWMSKEQIISLLPERKDEIQGLPYTANRDDKFVFLPENYQYGIQNTLPYDEYWYLDYRDQKLVVDTQTGESLEWEGTDDELKMFLRMHPELRSVNIKKETTRLAISVANRVMWHGPNPFSIDKYPFVGVFGYFCPDIPYFSLKMQGMVRGLRDAQFLYNRRKVIELDILESQINSGLKYKEDALVDPNDAFLNGQGRALALRRSASMDDVQTIPPPDIPATIIELSKVLGDEMGQISGVNEELLGSATDEKAGILSMLRQGAGLTTLQRLFDQLDASQKQLGEICIDLVQKNFGKAKVEQITGKPETGQFKNKLFPKYNCQVEEGILTASQKQMQFVQLMELRNAGIAVPDSVLLKAVQIQNKKDLVDAMQAQEEQAQQQQQQQSQLAAENQQIVNNSLAAKAESDRALAAERLNKVGLDAAMNVERLARAQEDRDNGTLAKIKAAKELQDIDLSQLERLIGLIQSLQQSDQSAQSVSQQRP